MTRATKLDVQPPKHRFLITLITNVLAGGFTFAAGLVVARGLGPSDFGNYNFLLGSFSALTCLLNIGSSNAFYTFISQKHRSRRFFDYYFIWTAIQLLLAATFVLAIPVSLRQLIWFEHGKRAILLALFACFATTQFWPMIQQVGESVRDTQGAQVRNSLVSALFFAFTVILWVGHRLSFTVVLLGLGVFYSLFSLLYLRKTFKTYPFHAAVNEKFKSVWHQFYGYCAPLLLVNVVNVPYIYIDLWMLRKFGGSAQQGYYSLGLRFSAIVLLFSKSMIQIFWKEIAEAHADGNLAKVKSVYEKVFHSLYFVASAASLILIPFARELVLITLGPTYESAIVPLAILFYFPVLATSVNVNQTFLYGLGKTRVSGAVDLFFFALSLIAVYFFLAPRNAFIPGLELGAIGLSIKMVICVLFQSLLSGFFASRFAGAKFNWLRQVCLLVVIGTVGWIFRFSAQAILAFFHLSSPIILVTVGFSLYGLVLVGVVYQFPQLVGLTKAELKNLIAVISSRVLKYGKA